MISAHDLSARLAGLLARERAALGDFLVALADFDRQRRWADLGYSSLFSFLHRELGLSKGAAFYRETAAELVQRHPEVVEPLRDGRLCLTSVVELAKVLTPENRAQVLPRFFHCSKADARAVAVELRPAEVVARRDVVTAVSPRTPRLLASLPAADVSGCTPDEPARSDPVAAAPALLWPPAPRPPPSSAEPLTGELSRLHVTVSRRFLRKLESARDALSHSHPGAGVEEVLEAALDLLLERHTKRKGLVERPRREPPPARPEHVPAHVKREVRTRDNGRCQWPLDGGGVCGSTHQVELDHVIPRALGGPSTADNLRCLCRFHNQLAARQAYGNDWMDRFRRAGTATPSPSKGSAAGTAAPGPAVGGMLSPCPR